MSNIETSMDLSYNIAALCIAILRDDIATPEQAFAILEKREVKTAYNHEDTEDMIKMRYQGLSYKEIGEIYGISKDAAYWKIRRYKERTNSDGHLKKVQSK